MYLLDFEYKWRKSHITYKIRNWTAPLDESVIKNVFEKYIKEWTDKINLKVTETKTQGGDIEIFFLKQDMPDVLGYAYFPVLFKIFLRLK